MNVTNMPFVLITCLLIIDYHPLVVILHQHFEASEVGILVRCLCVPLVSIRVGKVTKEGNLLCPSATR